MLRHTTLTASSTRPKLKLTPKVTKEKNMALQLTSAKFNNDGNFPVDYSCNGRNVNPPLKISGVSKDAVSLVLIFDDPDAASEPAGNGQTFDHWIVYNLPAVDQEIAEDTVPINSKLGQNSLGDERYTGPCPPTFRHKYFFRLMELDCRLNFPTVPTKAEIETAVVGHIIEKTDLISYYAQTRR
jgi:Raf kinase inhibitor-like YbhB/YbcL family protein